MNLFRRTRPTTSKEYSPFHGGCNDPFEDESTPPFKKRIFLRSGNR